MRILLIAPFEEPVPPVKYGGVELMVYNLAHEMQNLGHEVYLMASGDSKVNCNLVPIIPKSLRTTYSIEEMNTKGDFLKIYLIPKILKLIDQIKPDIIYNHFAWRLIQFEDFIDYPMFSTIHFSMETFKEKYTYNDHKYHNYISISDNQRLAMPELNWVKTIYNGIDTKKFEVGKKEDKKYFAFLGRISPEKGIKEICEMIKKTDHKLIIAAKINAADEKYYDNEVKPLIDGDQIKFIGEVDHKGKVELLKSAKALLLWLNWEEPFGLVVPEAMACGTPVIVNPRGAMPELIMDKKTGFLVNSLDEMKQKLEEVESIDSEICRKHVETNFSKKNMAQEYLKLINK